MICVCAVVSSILALTLKKYNQEISMLVTITAGVLIFFVILGAISPVINQITKLAQSANISNEYIQILIKTLGICFICQFSSDACKDAGHSALASKVELSGKLCILILALPMIDDITNTAINIIRNS